MSSWWKWNVVGAIITWPLILSALIYSLFVGGHSYRWQNGCVTFISARMVGRPGGQCWCRVIGFANEAERDRADLQGHERCHVVQAEAIAMAVCAAFLAGWLPLGGSAALGPLLGSAIGSLAFGLAYGACFGWFYATEQADEKPGWHDDYRRNPFERQAYARQAAFLKMNPEQRKAVWT